MTGTYSPGLVFLSIVVAILASYTALDLAKRISSLQVVRQRHFWLIGGAVAMGVGIWSMHFIGMLAFIMPIPLGYDVWITLLSLGIAMVVSWFALYSATMRIMSLTHLLLGGVLMGIGICAMHYTGMAAMMIHPGITYVPWIFAASVLIAVTAAIAAMWIAFTLRGDSQKYALLRKFAAAVVMGFAITGMHYTGMAAAIFAPGSVSVATRVDNTWLTITIVVFAFSILTITLILSVLDARMEASTNKFTQSLKNANDQLMHLATHDALTDLPNRLVLADRIQHAIHASERNGKPFAVIYVDLDGFKVVNDSLGHLIGDSLLKAVAERLLKIVRREDTLCRVGGDEFVVLIEDLGEPDNAMQICEKIHTAMRTPFSEGKAEMQVTTSIGIAIYPNDGDSVESLLHSADAAMYEVKRSGRNGYRYFEPAMNTNAVRTLRIQTDLRKAFGNGELYLHYQPKFISADKGLIGAEALLRWKHAELGQIGPDEFIPIAERSGLILEVGEWVIREVCRQLVAWRADGIDPVKIAVNLSAKHLRQRNVAEKLSAIVGEYGLDPNLLMLEITESAAMEDAEANVITINKLQSMGFDVAIDDFGTGYSSLSYLQQFRVHQLKIDRFFVDGLDKNSVEGSAIVSAVIALAHALQMEVVAEGVETDTQWQKLKRLSCDQIQGFLPGKPMSADDFTVLLNAPRNDEDPIAQYSI
jgi:diguanylate cyclase (GGDEF)-like protein